MFLQADAARLPFADLSFDLVLGSSPYCDARTYGINAQRNCLEWVEWMLQVTQEACRVSKGLVLWVATGVTRKWCYWPACEGLMWEWFKRGNQLWRPAFWHRDGIPGGGGKRVSDASGDGPQWLRPNVEYVMAFTNCPKRVPWAEATANGHPPKWQPGGDISYRLANGERVNEVLVKEKKWANKKGERCVNRDPMGFTNGGRGKDANGKKKTTRRCARGHENGDVRQDDLYTPPVLANPGCLIQGIKVGGGLMGHQLAHENEAPFPLKLAQYFIRGWCPPGGLVLDPFSGSGTVVHAAATLGRRGVGCDLRFSQCELGRRRCNEVQQELFQ